MCLLILPVGPLLRLAERMELSEISLLISQAVKDKEKPVIIQVDQSADATILAKLVSEAKKVAQSVSLATLKNR